MNWNPSRVLVKVCVFTSAPSAGGRRSGGGLEYNNSFRIEHLGTSPEIQQVYGPSAVGSTTFLYFGAPYADTTKLYNNVAGYFRNALTQKHNLSFSGAAADNRINGYFDLDELSVA